MQLVSLFYSIFLFYFLVHKSSSSVTLLFWGVLCGFISLQLIVVSFFFILKLIFFIYKIINVLDACFDLILLLFYSYFLFIFTLCWWFSIFLKSFNKK